MPQHPERVFDALAAPARRQLLTVLADESPRTATQLAGELGISRQGVAKHLNMLAGAGLVRAQAQGREVRYWLAPQPLEDVTDWVAGVSRKWQERLLQLKTLVEE